MYLRVASLALFVLTFPIAAFAPQQKCCTCRGSDGRKFQVPQSAGCDIACKASQGVSIGVEACMFGAPPPGSIPLPKEQCLPYWSAIPGAGDCRGNHWIECGMTITQVTPTAEAGEPVQVDFTSQNLGQEVGPRNIGLRHRLAVAGSVDWGDRSAKSGLDTGHHTLTHKYDKPGQYTVSAEIHGDFKWNEGGGGNGSCSYRARTAPASITINVFAKSAETGKKSSK
jgi:hypothetical protein